MNREDKIASIEELKGKFETNNFFYVTDSSGLTVEEVNELRAMCYEQGVEMKVAKNTLIRKALEEIDGDYEAVYESLKGPTALMFAPVANVPAKVLKEFRGAKKEKPMLKAAYIDSEVFVGDDQVKVLSELKSKEDLIGEIITLLQSPAKNVISALKSSGGKLAGILKTLSERGE